MLLSSVALTGIETSCRYVFLPVEGAAPTVNKEAAACSTRPTRASTGIKRPVPEPKGGPAKRSKEGKTQEVKKKKKIMVLVMKNNNKK